MRKEHRYQIGIEDSTRGPRVIVFPEGEDPETFDGTGFFELSCDGGKTPEIADSLASILQRVLPSDQKGKLVLVDPRLLAELLENYAKNKL